MDVQYHPRFAEFEAARMIRDEAQRHLRIMEGKPAEQMARLELSKAQSAFDKVSIEIDRLGPLH